jgi:hypothetical protein
LALRYDNADAGPAAIVEIAFLDGACETAFPPPDCPL